MGIAGSPAVSPIRPRSASFAVAARQYVSAADESWSRRGRVPAELLKMDSDCETGAEEVRAVVEAARRPGTLMRKTRRSRWKARSRVPTLYPHALPEEQFPF